MLGVGVTIQLSKQRVPYDVMTTIKMCIKRCRNNPVSESLDTLDILSDLKDNDESFPSALRAWAIEMHQAPPVKESPP